MCEEQPRYIIITDEANMILIHSKYAKCSNIFSSLARATRESRCNNIAKWMKPNAFTRRPYMFGIYSMVCNHILTRTIKPSEFIQD